MPISLANKSTLIVLIVFSLVFLGLIFKPTSTVVEFKNTATFPLQLDVKGEYSNVLVTHNAEAKTLFHFLPHQAITIDIGKTRKECAAGEKCKFLINLKEKNTYFTITGEPDSTIESAHFEVIKYKNITSIKNINPINWAFIALSLIFLLISAKLFQNKIHIFQWICIFLTTLLLLSIGPVFTLIFSLFLFSIYKSRNFVNSGSLGAKKLLLFISYTIFFLLFFKYGQEWAYSIFANPGELNFFMPLGISYFIIRIIDTQLRWYRKQNLDTNFRDFIFFIIFPGTLIAGPIETIDNFYRNRKANIQKEDYAYGISRILIGLFKKIVLADVLFSSFNSNMLNALLLSNGTPDGGTIFLFAMSGLLYAYLDFSAYSDMAIGVSRLMGFKICENFNFPILAVNIREYWKRWHMSLSEWSFRNIYFPVLIETKNSYIPLFATMMTIGLWHAYSFSWFSWAIHHSIGMSAVALLQKRLKINKTLLALLSPIRVFITLTYVSMGFIFVSFSHFPLALELYTSFWKWILMV